MGNKEGEMREEEANVNPSRTGEDLSFEPIDEPWSRYQLGDGSVFELRLILTHIRPDPNNHSSKPMYVFEVFPVGRVVSLKPKVLS